MENLPRLFIGSSKEGLPVARAVQTQLKYEQVDAICWGDGIFSLSKTTIESLESFLGEFDFVLMVFSPDDRLWFRGVEQSSPRDNVVFELGLFFGAIGRHRSFIMKPMGAEMKIPSDLQNVTTAEYRIEQSGGGRRYLVAPACAELLEAIRKAPPGRQEALLQTVVFPELVLTHATYWFSEYLKEPGRKVPLKGDCQITVTDEAGTILEHDRPSTPGHLLSSHSGRVLWTSLPDVDISKTAPGKIVADSKEEAGWVLWLDAGYSFFYPTPIASRANNRVSLVWFKHRGDKKYILELHHELQGTLDQACTQLLPRIISQRLQSLGLLA